MKKYILIIIIILLGGCSSNKSNIYLEDKLYSNNGFIDIDSSYIEDNLDNNYLLYIYNNYCSMKIPCENIFKEVMDNYNISMYSISFKEFKSTYLYDVVKYAPSVIIVSNEEVIDYLDSNKDSDYDKYQSTKEFSKWLKEYIEIKKK